MQIKDKRAIVTGAASGLGLTICRELLRNGVSVRIILTTPLHKEVHFISNI